MADEKDDKAEGDKAGGDGYEVHDSGIYQPYPHTHEGPTDELAHAMGEPPEVANEPPAVQAIRRIDKVLGILELIAVAVFLLGLIGISTYKGISAKLLDEDPPWAKHFIWYGVFLVAMASAALSAHTNQLIKMDFVTRGVSARRRMMLRVFTSLFALVVLYFLTRAGWDAVDGYKDTHEFFDDRLIALSLPITAVVIGIHLILHALVDVVYLSRGEITPEGDQPVAH